MSPRIGYFLSCEEYSPSQLIEQAKLAERAGFEALWISDHFHPWNDAQGNSAYVWGMIGAISQACSLPITTAVTCPILRQHPAIVAQAAATAKVLTNGRFTLGIGTGEALNEHVLGQRWPNTDVRLSMLGEAVDVMRQLWTGESVTHHGDHYTVEDARIYTLPDEPVKVYVSAFGPKALEVAARIGDGLCSTMPEADVVSSFKEKAGPGKPAQVGYKVSYSTDPERALDYAHELWFNEGIPGEAAQVLSSPKHFEQLAPLVTRDAVAGSTVHEADVDKHVAEFAKYADAGYDEVFIADMGPEYEGFFRFYEKDVLPRIRG
ncbi:TIGR03557 family F420-dependent LLM class oxidoreductase [Motilibacter aurantiacus]|uniref:TIGR03557 family F420-dependent LLM class oxidoreductase n=1 Tax=Motilibacter aurantiacus TaxID=2714955 RepID=UPI001409CF8B|nr:TIGR03557 family F420-dependent LLM class oxidoreductase [Motilibacter aurantiacus]NHC44986.1 TIGR03557 family F420-dependent LLM class oxidoreductase [Motilibacter aurantiacus]